MQVPYDQEKERKGEERRTKINGHQVRNGRSPRLKTVNTRWRKVT